jgi:amidophosphoribosyltransferase
MAANNSLDQIRDFLGADSLGYLSLEGMIAATHLPTAGFCAACYTGKYPTKLDDETNKYGIEQRRLRQRRTVSELVREDTQRPLL